MSTTVDTRTQASTEGEQARPRRTAKRVATLLAAVAALAAVAFGIAGNDADPSPTETPSRQSIPFVTTDAPGAGSGLNSDG